MPLRGIVSDEVIVGSGEAISALDHRRWIGAFELHLDPGCSHARLRRGASIRIVSGRALRAVHLCKDHRCAAGVKKYAAARRSGYKTDVRRDLALIGLESKGQLAKGCIDL